MPETFMLDCEQCPESGLEGFVIRGTRQSQYYDGDIFVAGEPLLIAHDIVEHVNGLSAIGTVVDELEALGAVWFTRGHIGDLSRNGVGSYHTPEVNLASDVSRMFRYVFYDNAMPEPLSEIPESEFIEDFNRICKIARAECIAEIEIYGDTTEDEVEKAVDEYLALVPGYMALGAHKQEQKYGTHTRANNLFWEIESVLSEVWEGAVSDNTPIKLVVYFETGEAAASIDYGDDDYMEEEE